MKGIQHFSISLFIILVIILSGVFLKFPKFSYFSISIWAVGFFLILLGSLLPDSDSGNKRSLIFVFSNSSLKNNFKWEEKEIVKSFMVFLGVLFFPIASITNQLEKLLRFYTKLPRGHKQTLHTIFGVLITSLFWSLVFYLIFFWINPSNNNFFILLFWFLCLLSSQILHLLEDRIVEKQGWKISWKGTQSL